MRIGYIRKRFQRTSLALIDQANAIITEYDAAGFTLTLRQLYYQFVARDLLGNTDRNYKRLGKIINEARLAGLISWTAIEDRTRFDRKRPTWEDPADVIGAAARSYGIDLWEDQVWQPEVWIEKDALVGVFENICNDLDISLFSCRGYVSQSAMWRAAQRFIALHNETDTTPVILHFGDHDPSGIDMTNDIISRMEMFRAPVKIVRVALSMDQVEQYKCPPNPAKQTHDTKPTASSTATSRGSWMRWIPKSWSAWWKTKCRSTATKKRGTRAIDSKSDSATR